MRAINAASSIDRWSMEQHRLRLYTLTLALDLLAISVGFNLAGEVRGPRGLMVGGYPLLIGAIPSYLFLAIVCEAFSVACLHSHSESARRALAALGSTSLVIVTFAFFAQVGSVLSRLAFAYAVVYSAILLIAGRAIVSALVRWKFRDGVVKALLIVDGAALPEPAQCDVIDAHATGLLADLDDPNGIAHVSAVVAPYDRVYLCAAVDRRGAWITALKATGISVELIIPTEAIDGAVDLGRFGSSDTLILSRGPLSLSSRIKKRAFDLVMTVPLLIVLAPLMIAVAVAIKLESPGPVIFSQRRIGFGNRPFDIYKFRSMHVAHSDALGVVSTQRQDQRFTRVGQMIRSMSIDELPQLFNVLIGNMSLVGPRPHAFASTAGDKLFWRVSQRYWMRHASKPGITGLAQIRGHRGMTANAEDLEARLRSDLEYVQNWSFWGDLVILFATVRVIRHANAY